MFLSSSRQSVAQAHRADQLSGHTCPECGGILHARRPADRVWHWAHNRRSPSCAISAGETEWHLTVKQALHELGYGLEVTDPALGYRYDALSPVGRPLTIVEAIHSHSASYLGKSDTLARLGVPVVWVVHADAAYNRRDQMHPRWRDALDRFARNGQAVWVHSRPLVRNYTTGAIVLADEAAAIVSAMEGISLPRAVALMATAITPEVITSPKPVDLTHLFATP